MELIPYQSQVPAERSRDMPFYVANYDPFNVSEKWSDFLASDSTKPALTTLVGLNTNLVRGGFAPIPERKRIFPEDMCVQACLLSWEETLREQLRIAKLLGFVAQTDVIDISRLFDGYGKKRKRTFMNSMTFSLSWFSQLSRELRKKGWRDYFEDFDGFESYGSARRKIDLYHKLAFDLNIDRDNRTRIILDFDKGETGLGLSDRMLHSGKSLYDSLIEEPPFETREKLNLLLPVNCFGQVLPLINVKEIRIRKNDGQIISHSPSAKSGKSVESFYL